jgi:uncharacterized protein YqiB (DUF1249 family)
VTRYIASPPTTDPPKLLRESQIRTRHLRQLLAQADAETEHRESVINGLIAGIAGNDADD